MKSPPHSSIPQDSHSTMNNRFFRFALSLSGLLLPLVNRTNGTLRSGGRQRSYLLHVPKTYNPATPTPLVISLHGFAEWPAHQMQISHWNDLAERHGFLVVYPCGTEVPLRWHTYATPDSDIDLMEDVTFISDLIDHLEAQYNLDLARIYVNGLSNGGGMAFVLACTLPDRIAAVGSVAGFYPFAWSEIHPSKPVPAIVFHGTRDPIVPYLGGPTESNDISLPALPDWIATLADYNDCDPVPLDLPARGAVSSLQFRGRHGGGDVIFHTITGGGHSWPGGGALPKMIVGETNQDIDATEMMWDFFRQHTLPPNP